MLGVGDEPVLKRVDPHLGGLGEGHRAEVAADAQPPRVGFVDHGAQRGGGTVVHLEPGGAALRPLGDGAARVGLARGAAEGGERGRAAEVRPRDVQPRTGEEAGVDRRLQRHLALGELAPRRHGRGDAHRQVQRRRGVHLHRFPQAAQVGVLVQLHEAREHGVPGERQHPRALRDPRRRARAHRLDRGAAHDHRLVVPRGGAGAVHDADVREREDGRVHGDEGARLLGDGRALRGQGGGERGGGEERDPVMEHVYSLNRKPSVAKESGSRLRS